MFLSETLHSGVGGIDGVQLIHCIACSSSLRFWLLAKTSFFIGKIVGFRFVNTIAEADWRFGSARLPVSFANRKSSKETCGDEVVSAVSDAMKRAVDHLGKYQST